MKVAALDTLPLFGEVLVYALWDVLKKKKGFFFFFSKLLTRHFGLVVKEDITQKQ